MPGKMEMLGCGVGGIVDDPDALLQIQMGNGVQEGRELRQFQIMIPNDERGGEGKRAQKLRKRDFQLRGDAGGSMEKIPSDDELGRLVFLAQSGKSGKVAGAIALWHRQPARTESRRFPKVNVRNDERRTPCQKYSPLRKQRQRVI